MRRCLEALLTQDYAYYDILVLDNGSTDGTFEVCVATARESSIAVRVVRVDGSIGRLRNFGAARAVGPIVAYTDSDCVPAPDWLANGVEPFDDPRVGVVTGTTLPEHQPPYGPWHATREVTCQTWHFDACNVFFRREPLLRAGGFGDLNWGEDTIAGWAMLRAGWDARFEPKAVVRHDITYPGRSWHLRRVHEYGEIAAVVKMFPESRARLLWHHYFMRPRNAAFVAALAALALARASRAALLLAVPYARLRGPRAIARGELQGAAERIAIDASVFAGAMRSSVRWRTLVL